MNKSNLLSLFFGLCVCAFFVVSFSGVVHASLSLTINAKINDVSTDFSALSNPDASVGYDGFDLQLPNNAPSGNYSQFYSNISGQSLVIDSWPDDNDPRTLYLVLYTNPSKTGVLNLSWISQSGYDLTLNDFGNDSNYANLVGTKDMNAISNYSINMVGPYRYFTLEVAVATTPEPPPAGDTTGPTGPTGAVGAVAAPVSNLIAIPSPLQVSGSVGTNMVKEINVKNNGNSTVSFSISQFGLPDVLKITPDSLTLNPGETGTISVDFSALAPGAYVGKIAFLSGSTNIGEVPIIADIASETTLFDVKLSIASQNKYVLPGEDLVASVNIKKTGSSSPVTTDVFYVVKSFNGNTVYEANESIDVGDSKQYEIKIPTQNLPYGQYVLSAQVLSAGAFASSSAQFLVVNKKPFVFYWTWLIIISVLVIVSIAVIIIILRNRTIAAVRKR